MLDALITTEVIVSALFARERVPDLRREDVDPTAPILRRGSDPARRNAVRMLIGAWRASPLPLGLHVSR